MTEKEWNSKMYNTSIKHIEKITRRIYRLESVIIENPNTSYSREKNFVRIVEIYYLGRKELLHYYQILTTNFSFSNDDNAMGKFLKKISYLFDEVELLADDENNIVKILNLLEIKKRWFTIAEILSKDHKGEAIENYFSTISTMLENEESLISFLNEYKMFGLFFNGQYGEYELGVKKQRSISANNGEIIEYMAVNILENELIISLDAKQDMASKYLGSFNYRKDNLIEAYLTSETEKSHIKNSLLWIA